MNRTFKTVWNRVRRQLVAVNEAVSGASQASGATLHKGSTVTSHRASQHNFQMTALAMTVGSMLAFSTPAVNASWLTDNGGENGELTWVVGTEGTTSWNSLDNEVIELDKGETLKVVSSGSFYNEVKDSGSSIPNFVAGNRIANYGSIILEWVGSEKQGAVENEGNYMDNYGDVTINMTAPSIVPGGFGNTTSYSTQINGWEVYAPSKVGDLSDLEYSFHNNEDATFTINLSANSTDLKDDPYLSTWNYGMYGLSVCANKGTLPALNEGDININLESANQRAIGLYVFDQNNSFINGEGGKLNIVIDKIAGDSAIVDSGNDWSSAIWLSGTSNITNSGLIDADVQGRIAYAFNSYVNNTEKSASTFVNNGVFTFNVTSTSDADSITATAARIGANDSFINQGTFKGKVSGTGTGVKGFELRDDTSVLKNESGAVIDITLNSTVIAEDGTKAYAQGIYLNGGESFDNKGSITLTTNVDSSAATANTQFSSAVGILAGASSDTESKHSVVTNAEGATMTLTASGPYTRGISLSNYAELINEGNINVHLSRSEDQVAYGGDSGIWLGSSSTLVNSGNIVISSDFLLGDSYISGASSVNTVGTASAVSVSRNSNSSKQFFVNEEDGFIDIDMLGKNTVDGMSTGLRMYGVSISSVNASNAGTIDLDVTGDFGSVSSNFDVFSTIAFSYGEADTASTDDGYTPTFSNAGTIKGTATTIAEGLSSSRAKGWAVGLNLHGLVEFDNSGILNLIAHSSTRAKAASVEGSIFTNDNETTFEAIADSQDGLAYAFNVGKPNTQVTQSRSEVTNNGTINLIATSEKGTATAIYFSDGDITNNGSFNLNVTGYTARGVQHTTKDLEQAGTELNSVFINNGSITGSVNATMHATGLDPQQGSFTNAGTIDLDVSGGRIQGLVMTTGEGLNGTFTNTKTGKITLDLVQNGNLYPTSLGSTVDGLFVGANHSVINDGEITLNLTNHINFVKGIGFTDSTSVLKNTGTINIFGINYADYDYGESLPSNTDWTGAYGIALDSGTDGKGEKFSNEGILTIDVDAINGVSQSIRANGENAQFNNAVSGTVNLTVDAHAVQAYGFVYEKGAQGINDGTINIETHAGDVNAASATGIVVSNASSFTNNGTISVNAYGVTGVSNAASAGIHLESEDAVFTNNGTYAYTSHRVHSDNTSDMIAIRLNNGKFVNSDSGVISIDVDAPAVLAAANNIGINLSTGTAVFQNDGTVTITLHQEAGINGTSHGIYSNQTSGSSASLINTGTIAINLEGELKENVLAINSKNNIRNSGIITTNGSIYAQGIYAYDDVEGTLNLTGKNSVSTIVDYLDVDNLTNAGTLTIQNKVEHKNYTLRVNNLTNTGSIYTGMLVSDDENNTAPGRLINSGLIDISENMLNRFGYLSGNRSILENQKDGVINIDLKTTYEQITSFSTTKIATGMDMANTNSSDGGSLINAGQIDVSVESDYGQLYGVYFDGAANSVFDNSGTMNVSVTKTANDSETNAWVFRIEHGGTYTNSGSLTLNGSIQAGSSSVYGLGLGGNDTLTDEGLTFVNSGDLVINMANSNEVTEPLDKTQLPNGAGLRLQNSNFVNTADGSLDINIDAMRLTSINIYADSELENAGKINIDVNGHISSDYVADPNIASLNISGLRLSGGTFTNKSGGDFTFNYINLDESVTTSYADAIITNGKGTSALDNQGTITINLIDMAHRDNYSYLNAAHIRAGDQFVNSGDFNINSTTNGADLLRDGLVVVAGSIINTGSIDVDINTISGDKWGFLLYNGGSIENSGTMNLSGNNSGSGKIVFLSHDESASLTSTAGTIVNKNKLTATAAAEDGDVIFAQLAQGDVFTNESSLEVDFSGLNASGFVLTEDAQFSNSSSGQTEISLDGTGKGVLKAFDLASTTALRNAGNLDIVLSGSASQAYGIYSVIEGDSEPASNIYNTGALTINSTLVGNRVWGIYSENNIQNSGSITSNAAIYVNAISDARGSLTLSGTDTESFILEKLQTGTLTNAGTLTVGDQLSGWSVWLSRIDNTGTINAGASYISPTEGIVNNYGVYNIVETTDRIALALGASSAYDSIVWNNEQGAVLKVDLSTTQDLLTQLGSSHVAAIDMYSPQSSSEYPGNHLVNKGTVDLDVLAETGLLYGIVYDGGTGNVLDNQGTMTIDINKSVVDKYNVQGLSLRSSGTYANSGLIQITADYQGKGSTAYGINFIQGSNGGDRSSFTNSGTLDIGVTAATAYGIAVSGADFQNQGDVSINLSSGEESGGSTAFSLAESASLVSSGSVDMVASGAGVKRAVYLASGSSFTNAEGATWSFKLENLTTEASETGSDVIITTDDDLQDTFTNDGSMKIELTDLGQRKGYLSALHVRNGDLFVNNGSFELTSLSNTSEVSVDALLDYRGTIRNTGTITADITSLEGNKVFTKSYGAGLFENSGLIDVSLTNAGSGNVIGFTRAQTSTYGYESHFLNNNGGRLVAELEAVSGSATLFDLAFSEKVSNAGTLEADIAAGSEAVGWTLAGNSTLANDGTILLTLGGLSDQSVLYGVKVDGAGSTQSNAGNITVELAGQGSAGYGIYGADSAAVFTNTGDIVISSGAFAGEATAINWAGTFDNAKSITAEGSVSVGTLSGTGSLSVTKGSLTATNLTQNLVTLSSGVAGSVSSVLNLASLAGDAGASFTVSDTVLNGMLGDISGFEGSLINHGTLTASNGGFTIAGSLTNAGSLTAEGGLTFVDGSSLSQTAGTLTTNADTVIGTAGHNETTNLNIIGINAIAPEDVQAITTELFKIFVGGTIAQDLIDHATFEGGKVVVNLGDTTLTTTQAEALKDAFNKIWDGAELEFVGTVEGSSAATVLNQETVEKLQTQVVALKEAIFVDRNLQGENGAVTIGAKTGGISGSVGFAGIDNATSISVEGGRKLVLIGSEKKEGSADYVMVSSGTTTSVKSGSTLQLGSLGLEKAYAGSMGDISFAGSDLVQANVEVVNGSYSVGALTGSYGNLHVKSDAVLKTGAVTLTDTTITNNGTMTVAGDMTLAGSTNRLTNNASMSVIGNLKVSGVLTNAVHAFLETNDLSVTGQLVNYGDIEALDTSTLYGTLVNQGEIRLYDTEIGNRGALNNTATLTQTGTIDVNGLLSNVAGATANFESVTLDGADAVLENTGTITIDKLVVANGATAVNGILTSGFALLANGPTARENIGELEITAGQAKTNAADGYYGKASIAGSFINTAGAKAVFGVSDAFADGSGAVIASTGLISNYGSVTFSGALDNAGTISGSGTITMANADGAANTFTNSGMIDVGNIVADGITYTQTAGSTKSDGSWFSNSTINLEKGSMEYENLGTGNTYNVGSEANTTDADAVLTVGTVTSDSVVNINAGGTLAADKISLDKDEKTIHLVGGTLQTNLDQIFGGISNVAIDLDAENTGDLVNTNIVTGVGAIKDSVAAGIEFGWGTVAFNDAFYATTAAGDVLAKLEANDATDYGEGKDLEVVFNGNADVKLTVDVANTITASKPEGGEAFVTFASEELHNISSAKPGATTLVFGSAAAIGAVRPFNPAQANVVEDSMGFKGISGAADGIWVNSDAHLVLVGDADDADYRLADGTITVADIANTPTLTLGSYGSATPTKGHLDYVIAGVMNETDTNFANGVVEVRNGSFTIDKADVGGRLTVGGNGEDRPEDHTAESTVDNLTLVGTGQIINDAVLTINTIAQRELTGLGKILNRGNLHIGSGEIFSFNNEAQGTLTADSLTILSGGTTNYGSVTVENLTIGGEYRWGVGGDDGLGVKTSGIYNDAGTTNVTDTLQIDGKYHLRDGALTANNLVLSDTGSLILSENEVTYEPGGTVDATKLTAEAGSTIEVTSGSLQAGEANLSGSLTTGAEGSVNFTDLTLTAEGTIVNDGSLIVENDTTIVSSITGSGDAAFAGLTIESNAQVAMTGASNVTAGAVVVKQDGTFTNTGSTNLASLTAMQAEDLQFGSLSSTGSIELTATNMVAGLTSAQNLTVHGGNLDATSTETTTIGQDLTLEDGTHDFSDVTVKGTATLKDSVFTADSLEVGGTTSVTGGSVAVAGNMTSTGKLTTSGTSITADSLTVTADAELTSTTLKATVSVDGALSMTEGSFVGKLTQAGATTIKNVNEFTSTGTSNLASLDADNAVISLGSASIAGLTVVNGGKLITTEGGLSAGSLTGTDTTIDVAGAVTSSGASKLTRTDFDAVSFSSEGDLTVEAGTFDAAIEQAGIVKVTSGAQLTSTGASTLDSLSVDGSTVTLGSATVSGSVSVANSATLTTTESGMTVFSLTAQNGKVDVAGTMSVARTTELTYTDFDAETFSSDGDLKVSGGTFDANLVQAINLVVSDYAKLTSSGATEIASLDADGATLAFGDLTVAGLADVNGGSLTANSLSAGQLNGYVTKIDVEGAVSVGGSTTLTGTDFDAASFSSEADLTIKSGMFDAALVKANNLVVSNGAALTSKGQSSLGSLDADDSEITLGSATVTGVVDVNGGFLKVTEGALSAGSLTGTYTTINVLGTVTSVGATTLANTDFDAAGFTSQADLTISGGTFDANLAQANNLVVSNAATLTSAGETEIASLDADAATLTFVDLTVAGLADVNGGSLTANSIAAGQLNGIGTKIDVEGGVSVGGSTTLTGTEFEAASFSSDGDLTVTDGSFAASLVKADDVVANGTSITSTGASSLGTLDVSNNATVSLGSAEVAGAVTVNGGKLTTTEGGLSAGSLTIKDATDSIGIAGTVSVTNNTSLTNSNFSATGFSSTVGSLSVTGGQFAATAGDVTVGGTTDEALKLDGTDFDVAGAVNVAGGSNLFNTTFTAGSFSSESALTVSGGSFEVGSLSAGATILTGGSMTVDNKADFADLTTNDTALTLGATTVAGAASIKGGTVSFGSLEVAGEAVFNGVTGEIVKGEASFGSLATNDATNISFGGDATVQTGLTNAGTIAFNDLTVSGQSAQITNTGSISADSISGSGLTFTQTAGSLDLNANKISGSSLTVTGGSVDVDTLGQDNEWVLGSNDGAEGTGASVVVGELTSDSNVTINQGAALEADKINLDGTESTVILAGGTLSTMLDQIFTDVIHNQGTDIGAQNPGDVVDVEGFDAAVAVGQIKDTVSAGIDFNSGTVAFNDKTYSLSLASDVLIKLEADDGGDLEVLFNGKADVEDLTVDIANGITATKPGSEEKAYAVFAGETLVNKQGDSTSNKLVVGEADSELSDANRLESSMGFMQVTGVTEGLYIRGEGTEFVLVGADDSMPGIDADNLWLADGAIDVGEGATMTFGSYGKTNASQGKFTNVAVDGTLHLKNGTFTGTSVAGSGTVQIGDADQLKAAGLVVENLALTGGALNTSANGSLSATNSVSLEGATVNNAGSITTAELSVSSGSFANTGLVHADSMTLADGATLTQTGEKASVEANSLELKGSTLVVNGGSINVSELISLDAASKLTAAAGTNVGTDATEIQSAGSFESAGSVAAASVTTTAGTFVAGTLTAGTASFTDTTVGGTLAVANDLTMTNGSFDGALVNAGKTILDGLASFTSTGTTQLASLDADNVAMTFGELTVNGLADIAGGSLEAATFSGSGDVTVKGAIFTAALTSAKNLGVSEGGVLTSTGNTSLATLTVEGGQTSFGGLTVEGVVSLTDGSLAAASISANGITANDSTLTVTDGTVTSTAASSLSGVEVSAAGWVSDASLTISGGSFEVDSLKSSELTVLDKADVILGSADIAGAVSLDHSDLSATGSFEVGSLTGLGGAEAELTSATLTGAVSFTDSDLTVTGHLVAGSLSALKESSLAGSSIELGSAEIANAVDISGSDLTVSGSFSAGSLTASNGSSVELGETAIKGTTQINSSDLTVHGAFSTGSLIGTAAEITADSIKTAEDGSLKLTDSTLNKTDSIVTGSAEFTNSEATTGSIQADSVTANGGTYDFAHVEISGNLTMSVDDTHITIDTGTIGKLEMHGGDLVVDRTDDTITVGSVVQDGGWIHGLGNLHVTDYLQLKEMANLELHELTAKIVTVADNGSVKVDHVDSKLMVGSNATVEVNETFAIGGGNGGMIIATDAEGTIADFSNKGTASFGDVTVTGDIRNEGTLSGHDVTITAGSTVTSSGILTSDSIVVENGASVALVGNGSVDAGYRSTLDDAAAGSLGDMTLGGSFAVENSSGSIGHLTMDSTGTFEANKGGVVDVADAVVNGGSVAASGGSINVGDYNQTGGSLTVEQSGQLNAGSLQVSGADVILGEGALNASGSIDESDITITGGAWGDNLTNLTGTKKDALGGNNLTIADGTLDLGDKTLTNNADVAVTGGTLIAGSIDLTGSGTGSITIGQDGTLQTGMDQIFEDFVVEGIKITAENWDDAWGAVKGDVIDAATNVGDVKDEIASGIEFAGGTISFDDEAYRSDIVSKVGSTVADVFGEGNAKVEFIGHAVDDFTLDTVHDLEADGMGDKTNGLVFANDTLKTEGQLADGTLNIGKGEDDDIHMNIGFAGVEDAENIVINDGLEFVLTGQTRPEGFDPETGFTDDNKLLVDSTDGGKITVNNGTQTIGSDGIKDGTVGWVDEVEVAEDGSLVFKNGEFAVNDITNAGTVHIKDNATDHTESFENSGTMIVDGTLDVDEFIQTAGGNTTVGGDMVVNGTDGMTSGDAALSIGADSSLTVSEGGSLSNNGHGTVIDGSLTNNGTTDYKDVVVNDGGILTNNGDESGESLDVNKGGEYVNNGSSNWGDITIDLGGSAANTGDQTTGSIVVDGAYDNDGTLVVDGDGDATTPDLSIGGNGSLVNDGTLIAGGDDTTNTTIVDGDLVNNGNATFDDMEINNGGHYHNTETGSDKGDSIDVADGGKWTNDGDSAWGSVNIDGDLANKGDLVIGDGDDATDDFHVGPNGSVTNDGLLDASDAGHTVIEGDFTTGTLNPDGTPGKDAETKFDNTTVANGGSLTNNGTETGNNLVVNEGGEYVNNGNSNWGDITIDLGGNAVNTGDQTTGSLVVDGSYDNDGTLVVEGDGDAATPDLSIGGNGSLVNDGTLIAGGDDTNNSTIVDGDLVNNGNATFDDMEINNGGHYHNTETGSDKGDSIDVADGGKWTNDGDSAWGSVNIDGDLANKGDLVIGDGDDATDDFHVGPNGSVTNDGKLDASDAGHTEIEGDFTTGEDGETIFGDVTVSDGGSLTNHGKEEGDKLVVEEGGRYENTGDSAWDEVVISGDITNTGDTSWGSVTIDGGTVTVETGTTDLGDVTMTSGTIVVGNNLPLDEDNKATAKWESPKTIDLDIFVIGNGELALGKDAEKFGEQMGAPVLPDTPSRLTITTPIKIGSGTIAVGSDVYEDKDNHLELTDGSMHFGDDSFTLISASAAGDKQAAISTETEGATLTIEEGATLTIGNIQSVGDYVITEGFDLSANLDEDGNWIGGWNEDNLYALPQSGSGLGWNLTAWWDDENDKFWVHAALDDVLTLYPDIGTPGIANDAMNQSKPTDMGDQFIQGILTDKDATAAEKTQAINSVLNIAASGATMQTAFVDALETAQTIESRVSFAGDHFDQSGTLKSEVNGSSLWVKATAGVGKTHGAQASGNMKGGTDTNKSGIVLGADYVNQAQSAVFGAAFSYTKSSIQSTGDWLDTTNSVESYGFSAYGAWTPNENFNLLGQIGYQKSTGTIGQTIGFAGFGSASADVDSDVIFGGLRAEYRLRFGDVIVVPHAGVRVVHGLSGDFTTKVNGRTAFTSETESTTTWQTPVGIAVRGTFETGGGWTFRPGGDISVAAQFGDTEQDVTVRNSRGASDVVNGQFAGDFVTNARLGFELEKDNATIGVNYGFSAGEIDRSHSINATVRFLF